MIGWQVKSHAAITLLICCLIVAPVHGKDRIVIGGLKGLDPFDARERYSILLALSGGGARGLAAIGVLKAFEEKGIDIAAVAGTSMGGIVGGLYAAGYSPEELASIVHNITFDQLFTNAPSRKTMFLTQREERDRHLISVRFNGLKPVIPRGLTAGQRLTSLLTTLTTKAIYHSNGDFNKLPIPFATVSTDVITGNRVVHQRGSLTEAMRATMAFPLAFTGLEKNGQLLMDGGMVTPLPVELVRQICDSVSFVVAVNTTSPLLAKNELLTPVDLASQVTTIMTSDKLAAQLQAADFVIKPPMDNYKSMDFKFRDSLIEIGYQSGKETADSIISLLQQRRNNTRYTVAQIEVNNPVASALAEAIGKRLLGKTANRTQLVSMLKSMTIDLNLFQLQAEITPLGTSSDKTDEIQLSITAYPCLRVSNVKFKFRGNTVYNDTILATLIRFNDTLLTPRLLQAGLDRILSKYHASGFDLADVREATIAPRENKITVVIDEAIINQIDVEGNERTKDWFVRSHFPLKIGQPYSTIRAAQGIANIFGTDLFNQVMVDLIPYRSGAIVKIRVEEKKHLQLRLGWHWDDEYRSEEFIEILDDDIGGIGLQFLLHSRYAPDRQRYFASFKANRIFKTYLTGKMRLYLSQVDRHLFDKDGLYSGERKEIKTGAELQLGQQISKLGTVTAGITLEKVEYQHPDNKGTETFGLRIFKIKSLVETFNRVPFPETGKKHLFELQFAGKYLGGEVEFTRFFTSLEAYFALGKYLNYHPKISLGLSRSGLPVSEKFYLGGMHSFVGFHTDQLLGDKLFAVNNELRVKLPLRLYLTGRYDMGEVYTSTDQIKLRNLRHGIGISLTLNSPIGPLELGYGVADTDQKRFYINAGYSF